MAELVSWVARLENTVELEVEVSMMEARMNARLLSRLIGVYRSARIFGQPAQMYRFAQNRQIKLLILKQIKI